MPKSFLKTAALFVFPVIALYALILVPAFEIIACDIMLMHTLLFDAVDLLMQWVEIFALALILSFLLVGVARADSLGDCRNLFYLLGGALLFKYVGAILALSVVHGSFDVTSDYGSYLLSLVLELLPCALLVWLTHRRKTADDAQKKDLARAAKTLGEVLPEESDPLPFTALFGRNNPLQRIAYLTLGVLTAIRALAFIASEIAYTMLGFAPSASDLPVMLLYFFLLILIPCFVGYLILYGAVRFAAKRF